MAENATEKAARYLVEGRLNVERVSVIAGLDWIIATCRGSDQVYRLGWDPRPGAAHGWRCSCEANTKFNRLCSHLRALQLVTTKPT